MSQIFDVLSVDEPLSRKEIVHRLGLDQGKYCSQTEYVEPREALAKLVDKGLVQRTGQHNTKYLRVGTVPYTKRHDVEPWTKEDVLQRKAQYQAAGERRRNEERQQKTAEREKQQRLKEQYRALKKQATALRKQEKREREKQAAAKRKAVRAALRKSEQAQRKAQKAEQRKQAKARRAMLAEANKKAKEARLRYFQALNVAAASKSLRPALRPTPRRDALIALCSQRHDLRVLWEYFRACDPTPDKAPRPRPHFALAVTGRAFKEASRRPTPPTPIPSCPGYDHPHKFSGPQ